MTALSSAAFSLASTATLAGVKTAAPANPAALKGCGIDQVEVAFDQLAKSQFRAGAQEQAQQFLSLSHQFTIKEPQIGFRASPRTGVRSGFCDATDRSVLGHRRWRSHTSCRFLASGGDGLRSFVDLVHIAQWTSNHETLDVDRATPVRRPLKASGEQATSEANLKIVAFGLQ